MSLAADLLEQAKDLLDSKRPENRGRPKQVDLRRSISTAYYSLFSLLVEEAATAMVVRSFTKDEAIDIVEEVAEAHRRWKVIKDNEATKVFLTALIVYKLVQASGTTIRASQSSVRGQ